MYYKRLIIGCFLVLNSIHSSGQSLGYSYKWQFLGPDSTPPSTGSAGSWTATGMGWIESLYVYPDSQMMLAGSITNGIFLTNDGGENWRQTLNLDPQVGVLDILVDGRKIYIATGATHFGEDFGLGLYRSRNKGKKWKPTKLEFLPENKTALWGVEMSLDESSMTAISSDAIYYSPKKAKNWIKTYEGKDCNLRSLYASVHKEEIVFAAGAVLLISDDHGQSWSEYTDSLTAAKLESNWRIQRIALAEDPNIPGRILAAYAFRNYVYIDESLDYGKHWKNLERTRFISRFDKNHAELAIAPGNSDLIVAGAVRCYISTGEEIKFSLSTYPMIGSANFAHDDIRSVYMFDARTIYIGTDGGVFMSTDSGRSWINKTGKGMNASMVYGIGAIPGGIAAGCQDLGYLFFQNGSWKSIGTLYGDGGDIVQYDSTLFVVNNGRFQALDITAGSLHRMPDPETKMSPFTAHFVHSGSLNGPVYFVGDAIWRYQDKQWKNLTAEQDNKGYKITAFCTDTASQTMFYAYDQPSWGNPMLKSKFFRSLDGGETWEDISASLPILDWRYISSVTLNPANPQEVFVSMSMIGEGDLHKVYRSKDGGQTWENWSEGLQNLNTYRIEFVKGSSSSVYLAAQDGLYYRNTTMTSWMKLKGELSNVAIRDLVIDYETRTIYVASYGNGVWALTPSEKMWTD